MTAIDNPSSDQSPTIFYSLPAELLDAGMSTADGQDILTVDAGHDGLVIFDVYTPADDPDEDAGRQCAPESRVTRRGERVELAVFSNTSVNASTYPQAKMHTR